MIYLRIVIDLLFLYVGYVMGKKDGYENGINSEECGGVCQDCEEEIFATGWNRGVDHVLAQQELERAAISESAGELVKKPKKSSKIAKKSTKKTSKKK